LSQRNDIAGRNHSLGCAIGSGKRSEVVIEGAIFFDDEDNVVDLGDVALRARTPAQRKQTSQQDDKAIKKKIESGKGIHWGLRYCQVEITQQARKLPERETV